MLQQHLVLTLWVGACSQVHYVVKGVQFEESDEAGGFGLVPANPVKLVADLPDGTTDEGGTVPNVVATKFRLYLPAVRAKTKPIDVTGEHGGNTTAVWYAPVAIPKDDGGQWPEWTSRRVQNNARTNKKGKTRVRMREEGEASSDAESVASSNRSIRARFGGFGVGASSSFTGKSH